MRTDTADQEKPAEVRMNCMEVWGGSGAKNSHVARPGLDIWIWSQSQGTLNAGGGDLHLLSSCASGRVTRMLLADVCAFGSLFHEIAGDLRELMKRSVNSIRQARVVRQMSHRLEEASHHGGFATTLLCTYFAPTRSLTLCNAGHPPPLIYRAASGEWSTLRRISTAATTEKALPGVIDRGEYQQLKTRLDIGDMVLGYGNALTECRNADGGTIGLPGLLDRVRQFNASRPSTLAARVAAEVRKEHADNLGQDDATLVLCRATATSVSWRDNMLAPFRLTRAVSDQTQFG